VKVKITMKSADPFGQDRQYDEAVHGYRQGRRRWKQVAIGAEAACGGNITINKKKTK